ncbi:DUF2383 domain-containing protein [Mucilaginibacter sp. L3T2-6]|uniref:DUF2383 domain-containing protein n=1 Tax=Mucilaginibacter sp. L3T2-6 TaxID=3062491 RepID=UPI0034A0BC2C
MEKYIIVHGGEAVYEDGGLLGGLHRTWINIKQAFRSKKDKGILTAITDGERAAVAKYDEYIADYSPVFLKIPGHKNIINGMRLLLY